LVCSELIFARFNRDRDCIIGAATYAELGTCIPQSGGEYAFLFYTYGNLPAFLYSWASNLVIKPGATALIALVAGQYAAKVVYVTTTPPELIGKGE